MIEALPYFAVAYLFFKFVYQLIDYVLWKRRRRGRRLGYIQIKPKRHR